MVSVIIAEKPSVANDIAKVLGISTKKDTHYHSDDIIVTWAIGHLVGLKNPDDYDPKWKDWYKTIDDLPIIPKQFEYKPNSGSTKKQLSAIKKLITGKDVTEIVNACDAAREGELIFREIYEFSKTKAKSSRMWLQSMTDKAILDAWNKRVSSDNYQSLADAAKSRSEADWIIGMNGSRIANSRLKRRNEKTISLGRVQTATLAMVVDKELSILSHIPKPYWQLSAEFQSGEAIWSSKWERQNHKDDPERPEYKKNRIVDSSEKERIEEILANPKSTITTTQTNREIPEKAPLNYDLTTLQKDANNLWSWSARRTLRAAQSLYESHKLTTYPRTDSRHLPEDMKDEINQTINSLSKIPEYSHFANNLTTNGLENIKINFNDSKVSDHFAIIPTGKLPSTNLSGDEDKLFNHIVRQFLSSWHPKAIWREEKRTTKVEEEHFVHKIRKLQTPGWRAVMPKKEPVPENWNVLPTNPADTAINTYDFSEELTKPPNRLKEAGLLRLMETAGKMIDDDEYAQAMKEKGLGTPATRADTIEKLLTREYINRSKNGAISATPYGIRLIEILRKIPVEWITSAELTGEMESNLTSVQSGEMKAETYMNTVIERTTEMVEKIRSHDGTKLFENGSPVGDCPLCGAKVIPSRQSYICSENKGRDEGCSFILWKDSSGRWFDETTVSRLINDSRIEDLHGFFTRSGEPYTATIYLSDKGELKFEGQASNSSDGSGNEIANCPKCDHGTIRETPSSYACDNDDCKFRGISKEMCKREISEDEAKKILTDGKSKLIEDFISKRGKPFSAYLILDGNKISYEFPPRAAPDAKKFPVVPGVVAVCPTSNAEIVETETHYTANNKLGCKIHILREISGREITREEAKQLIETNSIGPFQDFKSKKTGNPFAASLYLKKNQSIGYRFAKKE